MPLAADMPVWPGNDAPKLKRTASFLDGADSITSILTTDLHNGTHIDAPLHFLDGGASIEACNLDHLMGPAVVIDVSDAKEVTAEVLANHVPSGSQRVLIRSSNERRRHAGEFDESFVALTPDASQWLVDNNVHLVGIDYLSIALFDGSPDTHRILLSNDVTILEGLVLDGVAAGHYELRCLPLIIRNAEAAPARALLKSMGS